VLTEHETVMRLDVKKWLVLLCIACLTASLATSSAWAQTLDEATRQAKSQYNAKEVLSARTVKEGNRRVHVIKLLTKDGVVKTVRIPVREQ